MALTRSDTQATPATSKSISNIAFIGAAVLFIVVSMVAKWRLEPVSPVESNVTDRFSAEQAVNVLAGILAGEKPHPVNSEENDNVRQRIVAVLNAQGYHVDVQQTTSCRKLHVYVCAKVKNIIALHHGPASGKTILLSAHYDSVDAGPGASDDGAGVAVLLEVARMLRQYPNSRNSVLFLFTEGEETGLLGAKAFATQSPLAKHVAMAINIEARGTSGQSALFETGNTSGWLVDAFAATAMHPLANSLISAAYALLPNDTDLTIFRALGIQGLNFAYGEHAAYYHTPRDNLQSLNRGSLQQQGDYVYGLVRSLLNKEIPAPDAMGSLVYADILGAGMIRWPTNASTGIAIVLLLVFIVAHWRIRKTPGAPHVSVAKGFLLFVLSCLAAGLTGYLLMAALALVGRSATPWHSDDLANRFLLWSSVLLVVLAIQRLLGRNDNPLGIWIGVGYAWLLAGVASAICLPGVSYLFILPSLVLVAVSLLVLALPGMRRRLLLLFLLPAFAAFVIVLDAVFLVEMMLSFGEPVGVVGMGMLVGMAATFFAALMPLSSPSKILRYGAALMALMVAGSAACSIRSAPYSNEQPQSLNVLYMQRADGSAYLVSSSTHPPASVAQAMGTQASIRPVFPEFEDTYLAVPVASATLQPAGLTVLSTEQTGQGRKMVMRIDADASTRRVGMLFPKAMPLRSIEAEGQVMDYSGDRSSSGNYKVLNCRGESCNGMQLTLVVDSQKRYTVLVEKFSPLVGAAAKLADARNIAAVPHQDGDQSIVMNSVDL